MAIDFETNFPKKPDEWAMVCPSGIGDSFIACGFAEAILEQHGGKSFTVYTRPSVACIPKMFPKITEVRTVSPYEYDFTIYPFDPNNVHVIYGHFPFMDMPEIIGCKGITLTDCYRGLFHLSQETKISKVLPNMPEHLEKARKVLLSHSLRPGKTAIISPNAYSGPDMEEKTLNAVCRRLRELGWDYIINTNDADLWRKYDCFFPPLELVNPLAEVAGWVITWRNGMAEILSQNPCRLTILHINPDIKKFFNGRSIDGGSLKNMELRDDVEEILMEESGYDFIRSVLH